jgi:hypothetical protein
MMRRRSSGMGPWLPVLAESGLFRISRKLYGEIGPAFYGLRTTLLTLLMALLRIKRPEHLKERDPAAVGRLLGSTEHREWEAHLCPSPCWFRHFSRCMHKTYPQKYPSRSRRPATDVCPNPEGYRFKSNHRRLAGDR